MMKSQPKPKAKTKPSGSGSRSQPRKPTRQPRSYTPLSDALSQPLTFADTELAEGVQRHSLVGLLSVAISRMCAHSSSVPLIRTR